jgi:acetyl-CoA synthetase
MMGLDDTLAAFEAAAFIGRNWARTEALPVLSKTQSIGTNKYTLSEHDAKTLLKTFGLSVPEGRICKTSEAAEIARQLGFPVTIKTSSASIAHKTEAGGVALNIKTVEEAEAVAQSMAKLAPDVLKAWSRALSELIIGLHIRTGPPVITCRRRSHRIVADSVTLLPLHAREFIRALALPKAGTRQA